MQFSQTQYCQHIYELKREIREQFSEEAWRAEKQKPIPEFPKLRFQGGLVGKHEVVALEVTKAAELELVDQQYGPSVEFYDPLLLLISLNKMVMCRIPHDLPASSWVESMEKVLNLFDPGNNQGIPRMDIVPQKMWTVALLHPKRSDLTAHFYTCLSAHLDLWSHHVGCDVSRDQLNWLCDGGKFMRASLKSRQPSLFTSRDRVYELPTLPAWEHTFS